MSDIHQRPNGKKFQFSYILFSSLIVFDIFVILNTIRPLVSGNSIDLQTNNSSLIETKNHTSEEEDNRLMVEEFWEFCASNNITLDMKTKMKIYRDWVATVILLLVDLVALLALKKGKACLLVPWMIIYCIGFCTCYFRALLLLIMDRGNKNYYGSVFYTLGAAIGFNLAWIFVCSIFKELIKTQEESRQGSTPV